MKVVQMSAGVVREVKFNDKPEISFFKKHEGTILEILFGAYLAYLFLRFFIN